MYAASPPQSVPDITSVWIVEDHDEYRDTIAELLDLEPGMVCSNSFSNCEAMFVAMGTSPAPDVVLMDIVIPDHMTGIEGVQLLRERAPNTHTIVVTAYDDDDNVFDAICAGARGYLLKDEDPDRILEAISEARNGGAVMSPKVASRVINMFTNYAVPKNEYNLTQREREVLVLLVDGLKKKEIAKTLYVEYSTIETHMRHIYDKLHVHSMTQAVVKAIREGLI